jgi:uncharacterized protein (DUF427 family)
MPKAMLHDTVIAESADTEVVEGNHYFRLDDTRRKYLQPSETTTVCPWKGTASYYHVVVNGKKSADAAWYYPDPKEAALRIKGRVAFWKDVAVED